LLNDIHSNEHVKQRCRSEIYPVQIICQDEWRAGYGITIGGLKKSEAEVVLVSNLVTPSGNDVSLPATLEAKPVHEVGRDRGGGSAGVKQSASLCHLRPRAGFTRRQDNNG
jgi:hypothetical protein